MDMSPDAFALLRMYIRNACGLVISEDKEYFIHQRLEPLAVSYDCKTFDAFVQLLKSDTSFEMRSAVINAITTNETSFFRDGHPWTAIAESILPELARRAHSATPNRQRFRFWSTASSTGQEAFSLAILIDEYIRAHHDGPLRHGDISILATDISRSMVDRARTGTFSDFEVHRGLTEERCKRYFTQNGKKFIAAEHLQQMIEFQEANLVESLHGMGTFDIILCRNVLIYLDQQAKSRIFDQLATMLHPQGWLLLGATENTYGLTEHFRSERIGSTIIYRKQTRQIV